MNRWLLVVLWVSLGGAALRAAADEPHTPPAPPTKEAIAAAIAALGDAQFEAREAAMRQLSKWGTAAVDPLAQAAAGNNLEVTWRAIRALGRILDTDDEAQFDAAEAALEQLEATTNRAAIRRAESTLGSQPIRRWKRGLARFEAAGGWAITRKSEDGPGNIAQQQAPVVIPTYLVIGPDWKGGDEALVNLKRMDEALTLERKLGVYLVDGAAVTPKAVDDIKNSLRLLEFTERGKARLAVSFNFDIRGRATEVGSVEPDAAELTRENLKRGDVIVKYDGQVLTGFDHLTSITRKHEVGDRIQVEVLRNGESFEFEVELTGWKKPEKKPAATNDNK